MSALKSFIHKLTLLLCLIVIITSCSKDTDLLSEYIIADNESFEGITLLADDTFFMSPMQNSISMDVLNNDSYNRSANVTVTNVSEPINGEITINQDNTLTYIRNQDTARENESVEDTFDYTIEIEDEESDITTTEEATVFVSSDEMGELKAFPGAEGYAKYTTGGRGGKVIHVTNLNATGPGSLKEALETEGTRTIVFDVGGDIVLPKTNDFYLALGNGNGTTHLYENVTIAGETAPFPGITIIGNELSIYTSNVILRYITIRPDVADNVNVAALEVRNWGTNNYKMSNIIIDHVTMTHGRAANLIIFNNDQGAGSLNNVTVQNSIIAKCERYYSALTGPYVKNLSFYQNFISSSYNRNLFHGYGFVNENTEYINNIVYGYKGEAEVVFGAVVDLVGNIWKSFPNETPTNETLVRYYNDYNTPNKTTNDGAIHFSDNFRLNEHDKPFANTDAMQMNQPNRVSPNSLINTWANTIEGIENSVFNNNPGNSLHQDKLDVDLIGHYFTNTGDFTPPVVIRKTASQRPDNFDTDKDGMADSWEISTYGDLSKSPNGDEDGDGFTNIESYFFSLIIN